MKFLIQVVHIADDGAEQTKELLQLEREELVMETLGLSLAEGKAMLHEVQEFVVERQAAEFLNKERSCRSCGKPYPSKGTGATKVRTVFGSIRLPNPRWNQCPCQPQRAKTFRPLASWLKGTASPELLFLETKWASLIPYGGVTKLLEDVLPTDDTLNAVTIRNHVLRTAERMEVNLGEEKPRLFEEAEQDGEAQPTPDGPMTVGIDGGFVRAAHKQGWFEVIAGKSVVAFRRDDDQQKGLSKCFSFVQTFDQKPRRRLWELLKVQGMQENQQVVFLSDGGESVRRLQEYLHPCSEHWLDWFHLTMRITVLKQQMKSLEAEQPQLGKKIASELESIKHFLWHGNTFQALSRLEGLVLDLSFPPGTFGHHAQAGQGRQ